MDIFDPNKSPSPYSEDARRYSNEATPLTIEAFEAAEDNMLNGVYPWERLPTVMIFPPGTNRTVVQRYLELAGIPYDVADLAIFPCAEEEIPTK